MNVSTSPDTTRAWVEVDLDNVVANARAVQAAAGTALLFPMVKADAYGLGAARVARALECVDPWGFGVATPEEGAALRTAGIRQRVVVFTPLGGQSVKDYREHDLRAVVDDPAVAAGCDVPFHLEIDTGMGRSGVRWDAESRIAACASPHLEGAFTHLYAADTHPDTVLRQWDRFSRAVRALGRRPPLLHVANSAGVWRVPEPLDLVRPGIFLYGGELAPDLPAPRAVAALRASVVSLRRIAPGDTVGYGGDWTAAEPTTVATLGIGYADGVPRAVAGRASVILNKQRRPIVGRITMDFVMIDVGEDDDVRVGDEATLIGSLGGETITVDEFAGWAGTVSYEVLARLGQRVPRRYLDGAENR